MTFRLCQVNEVDQHHRVSYDNPSQRDHADHSRRRDEDWVGVTSDRFAHDPVNPQKPGMIPIIVSGIAVIIRIGSTRDPV